MELSTDRLYAGSDPHIVRIADEQHAVLYHRKEGSSPLMGSHYRFIPWKHEVK
jgi:hypothetical protein